MCVFNEVAWWGMDKEYLKELVVYEPDDINFSILLIAGQYIKIQSDSETYEYSANFAELKTKTVEYFE